MIGDESDDEDDPIDLHMAEFEDIDQALRRVNVDYDSICGRPAVQPHGDLFFDLPLNPLTIKHGVIGNESLTWGTEGVRGV